MWTECKLNCAVLLLMMFSILSCTETPPTEVLTYGTRPSGWVAPVTKQHVIVDGTLFYFVGGGTAEIMYPPGYVLRNATWISPSGGAAFFPLFVSGNLDTTLTGSAVRVCGVVDTTNVGSLIGTYSWLTVHVDSMRTL